MTTSAYSALPTAALTSPETSYTASSWSAGFRSFRKSLSLLFCSNSAFVQRIDDSSRLSITERYENGVPIIKLSGSVNLSSTPQLWKFLEEKAQQKLPILILEMTEVRHFDTTGAATLIYYLKVSQGFQGKIWLVGLNERSKHLLEVHWIDEAFPQYDNEAAALAKLNVGREEGRLDDALALAPTFLLRLGSGSRMNMAIRNSRMN